MHLRSPCRALNSSRGVKHRLERAIRRRKRVARPGVGPAVLPELALPAVFLDLRVQ